MVSNPVTFDREQVATRIARIANSKIDSVTARTHPHIHLEPAGNQRCPDGFLKLVGSCICKYGGFCWQGAVTLGEFKESPERNGASVVRVDPTEIMSPNAGYEHAFPFRARDKDV